jgi:D-amino-acid dehydrogenase
MGTARRVVVIGGGVIGAASAYYLQRDGWAVTILEKNTFASGCSHANCGLVCPSHVLPLAEPGAVTGALKALFARNAPFSIRPRLDPGLWRWLWNFSRKCTQRDMLAGASALHGLLQSSMALFEQLVANEPIECEWEQRGLLFVYRDREPFEAYERTNRLLTETFSEPAEKLAAGELQQLEPALKEEVAGGWYYEHDAHLRSDRLLASWQRILVERGATIRERCEATGLVRRGDRAVGVQTSQGEVAADCVVVAAGALTPFLSQSLGCRIPIQPGKGYSLTMPRPQLCPRIPLMFPQRRVAVTPFLSGYRLGSIMEFAGYDSTLAPQRLQLLRDGAAEYLREPFAEPVEEEWYGWRPMTYDSLTIIDRSPLMSNVLIAAGHNMLGLSLSTGTGQIVAEMAGGRAPGLDVRPFAVSRFG